MSNSIEAVDKSTDLILLLLFARGQDGNVAQPVRGITKVMKLLFLIEKEGEVENGFDFKPYKMGPFSNKVYPQLEFLQSFPKANSPLVERGDVIRKNDSQFNFFFTSSKQLEAEQLTRELVDKSISPEQLKAIDDLDGGNDPDSPPLTGEEVNVEYKLTELGIKFAELLAKKEPALFAKAENVKKKYAGMSLKELLRYVYTRYPDQTSASIIKEQILGKNS